METAHANGTLPGILRLTPEVRHCIYLCLGLGQRRVYREAAPILYDLCDPSSFGAINAKSQVDDGPASFHGLLLSCRTIYSEASALLYSANWFVIHYQPRQSLHRVRALTPHALASLTNLKIVLNQGSCHRRHHECMGSQPCCGKVWAYKQPHPLNGSPTLVYGCGADHGDQHDSPLTAKLPATKAVLEEWRKTAAYLACHLDPGQLELSLVCDVGRGQDGLDVANLVLDGLRLLPRLRDCHIRLCEKRHPQLQQLAQEAVLHARGFVPPKVQERSPSSSCPSLLGLPPEVRLRILQYTDLITPSKEVMWRNSSPQGGYYIHRPPCFEEGWGPGWCQPECGQACQFSHCWRTIFPQPSVGCFCRARHTVFSSRCKCWAPPTPLFLACRTLHVEANMVFYSENRFIVIDAPGYSPFEARRPGDYPHESFAASYYLKRVIPLRCLPYLRFLELVFSVLTHENRPRDDHPAYQDWNDTVDWVRGKVNLPALTLCLAVAGHPDTGRGPPGSWEMTREQGRQVLATYNQLLLPLQRLGCVEGGADGGGLARFYANLPWPLRWSREASRRLEGMNSDAALDWLEAKDREIKARAERFVLGDRYELISAAGVEPRKSVWGWGASVLYF